MRKRKETDPVTKLKKQVLVHCMYKDGCHNDFRGNDIVWQYNNVDSKKHTRKYFRYILCTKCITEPRKKYECRCIENTITAARSGEKTSDAPICRCGQFLEPMNAGELSCCSDCGCYVRWSGWYCEQKDEDF